MNVSELLELLKSEDPAKIVRIRVIDSYEFQSMSGEATRVETNPRLCGAGELYIVAEV